MSKVPPRKKNGKPVIVVKALREGRLRSRPATDRNERVTENIVRDELRSLEFYDKSKDISVEEQKSNIEALKRLLRFASKSSKGGKGAPEFIITSPTTPDFVLIIECKSSVHDHVSTALKKSPDAMPTEDQEQYAKRVQRFAVDGVIHYAKCLSREFNVIAVAVSGETKRGADISSFLVAKGSSTAKVLATRDGKPIDALIPWQDYIEHATFDPSVQRIRFEELMAFSMELHEFMRDHGKLSENEKPLLVSGTLIALRSKAFAKAFGEYPPEELQREWMQVIKREIEKAEIPRAKKDNMAQPYSSIAVHPELGKATKAYPRGVLHELIRRLNEKVWPFISVYHDFDVVGQFYGEFLKYTGGDKKALGIVLTPRHITELCAQLANVNKDSKVLDICAGTGGFLISAMREMMRTAQTEAAQRKIKQHGLIGVEQQPHMFALAASNMILRGDGKANLHQGSCFDEAIAEAITDEKCDVGLLNPPFSQSDIELSELHFIKHMMDCLAPGGTGIAIVPISCVISPSAARTELAKHHTIEAVMSMPSELFAPVGTITCIIVCTAKKPHAISNRKTWFGYWRNDGFVKTKHRGRIDQLHRWPAIKERWIETFRNREVHPGESVMQKVSTDDEWCAEAYLETDYSTLSEAVFEKEIRKYVVFKILNEDSTEGADEESDAE